MPYLDGIDGFTRRLDDLVVIRRRGSLARDASRVFRQEKFIGLYPERLAEPREGLRRLVDPQLAESADPKVRDALACIAARVRSFANAHDMLLPTKDAGMVDLRAYLASLLSDVCGLYDERRERVRLEVKGAALRLDIDTSIRVGLIANELTLNSLKHALQPGKWPREGEGMRFLILARVDAREDGMVGLFFGDNGPVLPEGPGPAENQGLGRLIIEALTSQLGGRFSALGRSEGMDEPEASGARFGLVFPRPTA